MENNFPTGNDGQIFWKFFFGGCVTIGGFIIPAQIGSVNIWLEVWIKLFTTGVGAAMSGLIALLVSDFYKYNVKNKIFKHKKNGKQHDKDKAA